MKKDEVIKLMVQALILFKETGDAPHELMVKIADLYNSSEGEIKMSLQKFIPLFMDNYNWGESHQHLLSELNSENF
jgi:hypothetical protein